MPTTFHSDKDAVVEHCWKKMLELGADQELIAFVSAQTLADISPENDFEKMIDRLVGLAWREGFRSALKALESGALSTLLSNQGKN